MPVFYRVVEVVEVVVSKKGDNPDRLVHSKDFSGRMPAGWHREQAEAHFNDRVNGLLKRGTYKGIQFVHPNEVRHGDATYCVQLYMVQRWPLSGKEQLTLLYQATPPEAFARPPEA